MDITENRKQNGKLTSKEGQTKNHSLEKNAKMKYAKISKVELENLLCETKTKYEIARCFSISKATLQDWIIYYQLQDLSLLNDKKVKESYCCHFKKLNGVKAVARDLHMNTYSVKDALYEYGLNVLEAGKWTKVVNHVIKNDFFVPINSYLMEVIIGELLGDGCIGLQIQGEKLFLSTQNSETYYKHLSFLRSFLLSPPRNITKEIVRKFNEATKYISLTPTAQFRYHVQFLELTWTKHLASIFVNNGYKAVVFDRNKKIPTLTSDKTTGFDTSSSVQLFDIYKLWYPNNKKVIPQYLILTPNILLHWYIGDGSLNTGKFISFISKFYRGGKYFSC